MNYKFSPSKFYRPKGLDSNKQCYQAKPKKQKQKSMIRPLFTDFDFPHYQFTRRTYVPIVTQYIDGIIINNFCFSLFIDFSPQPAIGG